MRQNRWHRWRFHSQLRFSLRHLACRVTIRQEDQMTYKRNMTGLESNSKKDCGDEYLKAQPQRSVHENVS